MKVYEDTNPRALREILRSIDKGELALPDFQRGLVWEPRMTLDLIVSVAHGYPAGSLLRIRNTHNLFACREFEGAPSLEGRQPVYLLLDGQQRLTSLYQAFFGVGAYRYFLNVRDLVGGADFANCLFHLRADDRKVEGYASPQSQARELVMPLGALAGGAGGYSRWTREVARQVEDSAERYRLEDDLLAIGESWIQRIDEYQFPVVTLADSTPVDAICTIFETVNRTGVRLGRFDLISARFWPRGLNLRRLWAEAQEAHPILVEFGVEPYVVLQAIALAERGALATRPGDVLGMDPVAIERGWNRAAGGLAAGLNLLRAACGVLGPEWLPNGSLLPLLAGALADRKASSGAIRDKIAAWFWSVCFGQLLEGGTARQSASEYAELVAWLEGGQPPRSVSAFAFDPHLLGEATPRQRGLFRTTMCLLAQGAPDDLRTGAPLAGEDASPAGVESRHLFPPAYLERQGVPAPLRESVLNRVLVSRATGSRMANRRPSEYLEEFGSTLGTQRVEEALALQALPIGEDSPLRRDDFAACFAWRERALAERIAALARVVMPIS